ncbi:MAG: hypothetical protein AAF192_02705 [Pseudomonadota bacterium]
MTRARRAAALVLAAPSLLLAAALPAAATIVGIPFCQGALACEIADPPPARVLPDPNDGRLLVWNERQNVFLEEDLRVDRVAEPDADYVVYKNGVPHLAAGTVVSSHYVQWDPAEPIGAVRARIEADSRILAFITETWGLILTDPLLGLPEVDYSDFGLRGIERSDATWFEGDGVGLLWLASSPGDWARLITARSPGAGVQAPGAAARPIPAALRPTPPPPRW